jgi:hypothetical protein
MATTTVATNQLKETAVSHLAGVTANIQTQLDAKAPVASPAFTGTPTAPTPTGGDNTTKIATTAFVKAALDLAVTGLLEFMGDLDASSNPNYPSANKGDAYVISVAGKVGGASGKSVDVGDMVLAKADNAGGTEASVGTSWTVIEHNLVGALLSSNNLSDLASASAARGNLGLGNVDNTSDANKPVSTATQTALDAKAAQTDVDTRVKSLFVGTANASVSNTTTETSLMPSGQGSLTLGANFFSVGRVLRFQAKGLFSTAIVPGTLNLRFKLGSVTVMLTGAQTPTGALDQTVWEVNGLVACRTTGASGTVRGQADFYHEVALVGSPVSWAMRTTANVTLDTTASNAIDLTAEWNTADADNIITLTDLVVETMKP